MVPGRHCQPPVAGNQPPALSFAPGLRGSIHDMGSKGLGRPCVPRLAKTFGPPLRPSLGKHFRPTAVWFAPCDAHSRAHALIYTWTCDTVDLSKPGHRGPHVNRGQLRVNSRYTDGHFGPSPGRKFFAKYMMVTSSMLMLLMMILIILLSPTRMCPPFPS